MDYDKNVKILKRIDKINIGLDYLKKNPKSIHKSIERLKELNSEIRGLIDPESKISGFIAYQEVTK